MFANRIFVDTAYRIIGNDIKSIAKVTYIDLRTPGSKAAIGES